MIDDNELILNYLILKSFKIPENRWWKPHPVNEPKHALTFS